MYEARKRGVLFDLGHGGGSFLWPAADRAMRQGFAPDIISTDIHASSIMTTHSDMANCMSKVLLLGIRQGPRACSIYPRSARFARVDWQMWP